MLKKLIITALTLTILLCGCSLSKSDDKCREIFNKYINLDGYKTFACITSNLGQHQLKYRVIYQYNRAGDDALSVVEPQEISNVSIKISKKDDKIGIFYDDASLETMVKDIQGFTPVDCITALNADIKSGYADYFDKIKVDGKDMIKITFTGQEEFGKWSKSVAFDSDLKLCFAEIFVGNVMVLHIDFEDFVFNGD